MSDDKLYIRCERLINENSTLRAENERLKSDLARSEAETAACLEYLRNEMSWENFRAEMHSCGTDPVKMTAAERNAAKLHEFLQQGNRGEKVLAERDQLREQLAAANDKLELATLALSKREPEPLTETRSK